MDALNRRPRTIAAVTLVLAAGLLGPPAGPAAARSLPPVGVCAGVDRCERVAVIDVDGDGRTDQVGWRRLDRTQVQIRVRTAERRLLRRSVTARRPAPLAWTGATAVDGRPGAELVVDSRTGSRTTYYTMLTYRAGRIVVERAPVRRPHRRWGVAPGVTRYAGWHRHVWPSGRVTMTLKVARRDGDSVRLRGYDERYEWADGGWRYVRRDRTHLSVREAERIAGWHLDGLDRFRAYR